MSKMKLFTLLADYPMTAGSEGGQRPGPTW